jgi:hypothetical protein
MSSLPTASPRAAFSRLRRLALAGGAVLLAAACSSTVYVTAPPAQTLAGSTAVATPSGLVTASPISTATPTATLAPTKKPTPTPLPPLAVGLCRGSQLKLEITLWEGDTGTSYAHVTATNKSASSCNMRGTSEAQIVDGHGKTIADQGSGTASVRSTDPVYPLNPGDGINTIVQWDNWCKAAPAQKITVAMVLPFGLGRIVAPANGNGPLPTCYSSGSATTVSSEAWLP